MYNLIHDTNQIKMFVNLLEDPTSDESYVLSLSARKKYLTKEEQELYKMKGKEMFLRQICNMKDEYLKQVRRYCCMEGSSTTRAGEDLPSHSLIIFANINPSSYKHAFVKFQTKMLEYLVEGNDQKIKSLTTTFNTEIQRTRSRKIWIDVDFDIDKNNIGSLQAVIIKLKSQGVEYHVIETKGGFHLMMRRETVKFNYPELIAFFHKLESTQNSKYEVIINKNDTVPLPGTYQEGFPVIFREDL